MITENVKPIRVRTDNGWVIFLQHAPWSDEVQLWIGQEINGKFYSATVEKGGYLEMTEAKEGIQTDPTIKVNGMAWGGLVEALRGVTPDIDKKEVDAELKSTKYHLEDMRKLVFDKSK